jgi:hypothetical protein
VSLSLYCQPKPAEKPPVESLGGLKYVVRDRWFDGERRCGRDCDKSDLPYLLGIADGGGQGAEDAGRLAELIREHGTVAVWIGDPDDAPY